MTGYRWLVFDADGTLFDYDAAELGAFAATLEHYGVGFSPAAHHTYVEINGRLWQAFEDGLVTSERLRVQRFEEFAAALHIEADAAKMSRFYLDRLGSDATLLPGAAETVAALAPRFGLAVATNGIADVQHRRLDASPLKAHVAALVISDEVGAAKPATAFFDALFEAIGDPDRSEVLIVGDGLSSDIAGGIGYGIDTCWFNPGSEANESSLEPTHEISALAEILDIVGHRQDRGRHR